MFEIRVIVDLPGIPAALNNLADALRGSAVSESEKVEQNNAVELYRKPDEPGESPAEKDAASVPAGDPLNVPEEMLPTEPVSPNPVPEKKREYTFNQISRAGANLCLSVALAKKELKKISAVIVHSPLIDLSFALDHHMHEVNDFTVNEGGLEPMKRIYVGDADVKNPYISPMYGDFSGFPATFITCDYNETLYADADKLYEMCRQNDVKVELVELKGTFHAFPASGLELPETDRILDRSIEFIKEKLEIEKD